MKVYKIKKESSHSSVVIFLKEPISEIQHGRIEELGKSSDLVFVMTPSFQASVSPLKFATQYGGTYFSVAETGEEVLEIWGILDYLHELAPYVCYSVILQPDLWDAKIPDDVTQSLIDKAIYTKRGLSWIEKKLIYDIPKKRFNFFGYVFSYSGVPTISGMFSRYVSDDPVLFLRPSSLSYGKEKLLEMRPEYFHSFYGSGIKTFIPTLLEENHLNQRVDETKV